MAGTITHKWTGTTLTITSDSGTTSCDLKGEKGDDGARGAQGAQGEAGKLDVSILGNYATKDYVADNATHKWYGLGEVGVYCSDCNNTTKNGWFCIDTNTANTPEAGMGGTLFVETCSTNNGIDYYQTIRSGVVIAKRYYSSWAGAWQPWEWVNPPLTFGVEYRTTERYDGKPVYKKLIDCGKGTSTGAMNLYPQVGINIIYLDFNCRARSNSGWGKLLNQYLVFAGYGANDGTVSLTASQDLTAYNIYLEVKYYKV